MKPNIKIEPNAQVVGVIYESYLSSKIIEVCSKVGFNYSNITWTIFNPKASTTNIINQIYIGTHGKDYGYCIPHENKIWISTLAIERSFSKPTQLIDLEKFINKKSSIKRDLLVDVILDEITHTSTKCGHGAPKYENKLAEFKRSYYGLYI